MLRTGSGPTFAPASAATAAVASVLALSITTSWLSQPYVVRRSERARSIAANVAGSAAASLKAGTMTASSATSHCVASRREDARPPQEQALRLEHVVDHVKIVTKEAPSATRDAPLTTCQTHDLSFLEEMPAEAAFWRPAVHRRNTHRARV